MNRVLVLCVLLLSAPASAQFTPEERPEVMKLGRVRHEIAMSFKRAGEAIEARGTSANRLAYHAALADTFQAHYDCFLAWGGALNAPGISGYFPDRQTRVQDTFRSIDNCRDHLADARAKWVALGETRVDARLADADARLASFDRSLAYLEWQPASFPASFGPHGDWLTEQRHLHRTGQYMLGHSLGDVIGYYGDADVPAECNRSMRFALKSMQEMVSRHTRGWGLLDNLVYEESWGGDIGDDRAYVQAESDASNGVRPPSFFHAVVSGSYLWNKSDLDTQAGQRFKQGVNPHAFNFQASVATLVACTTQHVTARASSSLATASALLADPDVTDEERQQALAAIATATDDLAAVRRWWTQDSKTVTPGAIGGRALEVFVDFPDGWNDHDMPAASILGFVHDVALPPGGGISCDPDTTTNVDGVCVGDATCPDVETEMVLVSSTEARCVVLPQ